MTKRLIILGAPGTGKGTQADKISKKYNIPHIDTGGMLREEIASRSEEGLIAEGFLAKGQLAPASLVVKIIKNRLGRPDTNNGFVLDGFPRSIEQAEGLDRILTEINQKIDYVLNIDLDESILVERMAFRETCPKCSAKYNSKFNPSKQKSVCDVCGTGLTKRHDDNVETAMMRIDTYKRETEPLIKFYKNKDLIINIDGNKSIDEIFKSILDIIDANCKV